MITEYQKSKFDQQRENARFTCTLYITRTKNKYIQTAELFVLIQAIIIAVFEGKVYIPAIFIINPVFWIVCIILFIREVKNLKKDLAYILHRIDDLEDEENDKDQ